MYKRVIVKIGSGVISKDGQLDREVVRNIVDQIAALHEEGTQIILVTSGAVATGRGLLTPNERIDSIVQKQVFAAVGQVKLMAIYADLFAKHSCTCAQVLVTKGDFRDRQHYANMKNCLENLLQSNVIPIVNENDVVAITELIFTDNDELAGLLASQVGAEALIILSSVAGVLKGDPKDPTATVVPEIDFKKDPSFEDYISAEKSSTGRGGMRTKFGVAKKLAMEGITTHIANGKQPNVLGELLAGKPIGTRFVAHRKLSTTKRRVAHSEGLSKGAVYINKCAEDVLRSEKAASLLPVGIIKIEGSFEKGDVIEIRNEEKKKLGFGIAQYDSNKALESLGKQNIKALVHYDYMFLE